jgi:hypothetical protein
MIWMWTAGKPALTSNVTWFTAPGDAIPGTTEEPVVLNSNITVSDFCVYVGGAQPSSGSLLATVRKNAVDSALSLTIPLSSTTSVYAAASNVTFASGDLFSISLNNLASASAISLLGFGVTYQ